MPPPDNPVDDTQIIRGIEELINVQTVPSNMNVKREVENFHRPESEILDPEKEFFKEINKVNAQFSDIGIKLDEFGDSSVPQYGSKSPQYGDSSPQNGSLQQYGSISPQNDSLQQYGSKSPQYGSSQQYGSISPRYGSKSPQYGDNSQYDYTSAHNGDNSQQYSDTSANQYDTGHNYGSNDEVSGGYTTNGYTYDKNRLDKGLDEKFGDSSYTDIYHGRLPSEQNTQYGGNQYGSNYGNYGGNHNNYGNHSNHNNYDNHSNHNNYGNHNGRINAAISGISSDYIQSIEEEDEEDQKAHLLEEIIHLRDQLESDNVSLKNVQEVTNNSSYEDIKFIHTILRKKVDREKYCGFAEEFIMLFAEGMEEVFNGERVFFKKYRPDLTGWHKEVSTKLRRMRSDTSVIVSNVMDDFKIGPGMRLLMELGPNAIMYAKRRKRMTHDASVYDEIARDDAMRNLDNISVD